MNAKKAIITLSVLLGISVCTNAFLGGLALSHGPFGPPPMMRGHDGPRSGPEDGRRGGESETARFRGGLRDFARDLPPDVREPIMDVFKSDREAMGQRMRAIGDARNTAMDALKAEPFDVVKLSEALVAQRTAQLAMQESVHTKLLAVIETLNAEQRGQLARSAHRLFK